MTYEERLAAVERRLDELEAGHAASPAPSSGDFWVLDGLRPAAEGNEGVVLWAGTVRTADGPVDWQMGRMADELLHADDLDAVADRLAALGHPVRLALLLAVIRGTTKVTDLAEHLQLASTGQVYHHIKALSAGGWLRQATRGHVAVPPERVVPVLVAMGVTT
ncbi:winged helix-turn-helix transcriptional regulator [Aeromicrobium sp. YIM 150415]|uniref:ArsR/SmtB family transcription factor n=1 Tax=Aeromicrobium sp. YIM 150415 TaxID=2803912 RepID=UPI0019622FA0|nr:winged helix-turn-helix domain-containing protein [Aeromicrobium sp. YIM 150415]MBM9464697.1 winged helix-turn-helix transcriptional regulator [Aeromicrobium sp. YIM 150415]